MFNSYEFQSSNVIRVWGGGLREIISVSYSKKIYCMMSTLVTTPYLNSGAKCV
jgi:hypothetical protein